MLLKTTSIGWNHFQIKKKAFGRAHPLIKDTEKKTIAQRRKVRHIF